MNFPKTKKCFTRYCDGLELVGDLENPTTIQMYHCVNCSSRYFVSIDWPYHWRNDV